MRRKPPKNVVLTIESFSLQIEVDQSLKYPHLSQHNTPHHSISMAAFMRYLTGSSGKITRPPFQSGDTVYPVHMLDESKTLREIVVAWTLRFDDVLDADKLHISLSRLLEIGDWRKIGGRLRLKVAFCPIQCSE